MTFTNDDTLNLALIDTESPLFTATNAAYNPYIERLWLEWNIEEDQDRRYELARDLDGELGWLIEHMTQLRRQIRGQHSTNREHINA